MPLPNLTKADVISILDNCVIDGEPCKGGQKLVFPCTIDNRVKYAIKFMLADPSDNIEDAQESKEVLEVTARAKREVGIMRDCNSPYLIKLGPIGLEQISFKNQNILYFSEEWIDGWDLKNRLNNIKYMPIGEVIKMAQHMSYAIEELWKYSKIHRDIKPGNIIYSRSNENYILLDMGFAFDLEDRSLTAFGIVPGTIIYLSPEQIDVANKRELDFRSDLFNVGIVMYEALTGNHPFFENGMSEYQIIQSILNHDPPKPSTIREAIPDGLDNIVMRLLAKHPHLRYRSCERLRNKLLLINI